MKRNTRLVASALVLSVVCASTSCTKSTQRYEPTVTVVGTTGQASSDRTGTIYGTPGSPDATTTVGGNQLPPNAPTFGGVIKDDALQSQAWWPPRVVPPKGAPNVLLIMTDDAGFGINSTFGGVIQDVLGGGNKKTALTVNTGNLTLTFANTYSGPTTINAGARLTRFS